MSTTTGRIVAVEVVRAGATLNGDHAAGVTSLSVSYGWDFDEDGGGLSIGDDVYDYTSATFPTESDEDPTVLALSAPLAEAADDGVFVALDPESSEKVASVQLADSGSPVLARVGGMADRIPEGTGLDIDVIVDDNDGTSWTVTGLGETPVIDPLYLDETVELPARMIPGDGWTQFTNVAFDQLFGDQIQGKIAVAGDLWVARYASSESGETRAAPDSNVIHMSSTDELALFKALFPTGEVDGDGEPLYESIFTIPQNAYDPSGQRISALFRGRLMADDVTVLQGVTMQGSADDGFISRIAPGAVLQMDYVIGDPDAEPIVTLGPKSRRWPGLTSQSTEIGWGTHNGFVVSGRHNSGDLLQARFINPDTGLLDHEIDILPFSSVAGFTAGGGYLFVLAKFRSDDPWTITRWNPNGSNASANVKANIDGARVAALGFDGGRVRLLELADSNATIRVYGTGLALQDTITVGPYFGDRAVGVGTDWFAQGGSWAWLSGTGSSRSVDASRSWTSQSGTMTGAGALPDGHLAATNQSGNLYVYNSDRPTAGDLYASWTKKHTPTGRESRQSPVAHRSWPTRMFATVETDSLQAGVNAVGIYASGTSGARTSMWSVPIPAGQTQVTFSEAPTAGTHPPETSGFSDGSGTEPGGIVSGAKDPNGEPLTFADGSGEFRALKASQRGRVTVAVSALDTNYTASVTYRVPFTAAPSVTVSVAGGTADPQQVAPLVLLNESTTGFTVRARREGGTATDDITVNWNAGAVTQ